MTEDEQPRICPHIIGSHPGKQTGYIVYYLEGAAVPDEAETPNAETQEAFEELDNGGGHAYSGPVENLISSLLEDESA